MHRLIVLLALGGSFVTVAPTANSARSAHAPRADLRLELNGLPAETRVDGNVSYQVWLRNVGTAAAHGVKLELDATPLLVAVSVRRMSCAPGGEHLTCVAPSLRAGAAARVILTIKPLALGTIVVRAQSGSASAVASTPVMPGDAVHADVSYLAPGFRQDFTIDAISARHGEDPDGTFAMDWAGEHSTGRVTCVSISGNRAAIGVYVPPTSPPPPGVTATPYLTFVLTDNGSPGAGRDTFSLLGGAAATSCWVPEPWPPTTAGPPVFPITSGEISIADTP